MDIKKRFERCSYFMILVVACSFFSFCQIHYTDNGLPPPNEHPAIFLFIYIASAALILPALMAFVSSFFTDFEDASSLVKICRVISFTPAVLLWLVVAINIVGLIIGLSLIVAAFSIFISASVAEYSVTAAIHTAKDILGAPSFIVRGRF